MGTVFSNIVEVLRGCEPIRILLIGLDGSGKTSILYQMTEGDIIISPPTIGFNMEIINHKDNRFAIWDLAGERKVRCLWLKYVINIKAIIFVVDSSDIVRLEEAKEELHKIMKMPETKDCVLLVIANKQDKPEALNETDIAQQLCVMKLEQNWTICSSRIDDFDRLHNILDVAYDMIKK